MKLIIDKIGVSKGIEKQITTYKTSRSLLIHKAYQAANTGISSQTSRYEADDDMGPLSLTSRAPVNWKEANVPGTPPTQMEDDPIEED